MVDIRRAVLQLHPKQRLQLNKDAVLTLTPDEPNGGVKFDFDRTLNPSVEARPYAAGALPHAHGQSLLCCQALVALYHILSTDKLKNILQTRFL